jgi:membrane protease YdiL (CAAX protease family)
MAIALSGTPLSALAYLILQPPPLIPALSPQDLAISALILLLFVGVTEEVTFRGLLQDILLRVFPRSGLLWSAFAFAMLYLGSLSPGYVLVMAAVGLFFGWCVYRTGALWGVVAAHTALVVGMACVWPFLWP